MNTIHSICRKELLKLPRIGSKTADVFIAYCCGYSAFLIDTNINLVVKRIGIVQKMRHIKRFKNQ
jgi:endonuclease III